MDAPAKPKIEPKKIALLILLVVAAVVLFVRQSGDSTDRQKTASDSRVSPNPTSQNAHGGRGSAALAKINRLSAAEKGSESFKPKLRPWSDQASDEKFDPTLRTDLLTKLSIVPLESVGRNVFEFYVPPAPQKPIPQAVVAPVVVTAPPVAPPPPPPPPIVLKFYGYTAPAGGGAMQVFCSLKDQVSVAAEGTVLQHRYKINKISPTTVVVEDLEYHHQETLPIDPKPRPAP